MECPQEQGCVWATSRQELGPEVGEYHQPWGWKDLAVFSMCFGYVVLRCGKAHCSLVQGFMRAMTQFPG